MGKLGENVPLLIDKAVDFMASSQAFREYLKKLPPRNAIPSGIPGSHCTRDQCRYIYNVWSIIVGFIGRSR